MFPFASALSLASSKPKPASYVTSGKRNDASESTMLDLTGASVGDYVILASTDAGAVIAGGDGNWTATTSPIRRLVKKLTPGDLTNPLTCSAYSWVFAVYRRPVSSAQRSTGGNSNADMTIAGFTKATKTAGVVALVKTSGPPTALTVPAGFTRRQSALNGGGFAYDVVEIYDLLSPGTYTDNASVTIAPGTAKVLNGVLLELLN